MPVKGQKIRQPVRKPRGAPIPLELVRDVLESMPDIVKDYTHSIAKLEGGRGKPALIENRAELLTAIRDYMQDIVDEGGRYRRPPTMTGLGLYMGFHSRSWHEKYSVNPEYADIISHMKMFVAGWRADQVMIPRDGTNPAGIMFMMNRADLREQQANEMKTINSTDKRPADVDNLINDLWLEHKPDD